MDIEGPTRATVNIEQWVMRGARIVRQSIAYLGFNLRLRNQNCREPKMSIEDVVQAIVDDRKDKRIEIAAAVNCVQCIQFMTKCFREHKSRDTGWFYHRPYGETMIELFKNLQDYFPEIPEELWVTGYCVCGAEAGLQHNIERKMTYISSMNQFIAERHLSAAELTDPALKKEKVYFPFQDD